MKRKTIAKEVSFKGIGLHKGEEIDLRLRKAISGTGIIFKRTDLEDGKNEIKLCLENTFDLVRGTNIKNEYDAKIHTIEHFLSALYMSGVTDLNVDISGNELPIGDGSAAPFVELLEEAGTEELEDSVEEIVIKTPVYLSVGDKHIVALPYDGYKITYTIRFEHTFLKSQMLELNLDKETYNKEVAPARTFGFDYEVEYLKANNLALGGSLDNAIVIKKDGVLNPDGLRFEDEFVRHKILDIIGDLKVLNKPIRGHIIAVKAGHALDIEFAQMLNKI